MNTQEVINAAENLPIEEQRRVLIALQNNLYRQIEKQPDEVDASIRQRRLEWLKAHREEFAGQYVALDGDRLVGHGSTIRKAHEQAQKNGVESAFLVRLESEQTILPVGW